MQALGLVSAATVASPLLSSRAAYAATGRWNGPILLVLSLRGGFDGLSAIAPVGDPDYARNRPSIAIPASLALPTGDRIFGLHPALAPLKPMWDAGTMAAVHAVGTPDGTRSHFSATEELERAAPGTSVRTGWLNRVLGTAGTGTVFQAVQLGSGNLPASLSGTAPALAARAFKGFNLTSSDWVGPRMADTLKALNSNTTLPAAAPALLTLTALNTAAAVIKADTGVRNGAVYPKDSQLGKALTDAALLIRADVGLKALTLDVGDWDLHNDLGSAGGGVMGTKLTDLAQCLAAFAADLGTLMSKVTVLTISEFGRRVTENGSGGVDHGHGNAMLLLGGGLKGGKVHGAWPTLANGALDHGDLAGTTDYRSVLAECLVRRIGLAPSALSTVFPGFVPAFPGAFA
jgi:uncharacterized protein (DUF1501 family)